MALACRSGSFSPVNSRASSVVAKKMPDLPSRWLSTGRARSSSHSRERKLASKETVTPCSPAMVTALCTASDADALRAGVMPVTCRILAPAIRSSSRSAGARREPALLAR